MKLEFTPALEIAFDRARSFAIQEQRTDVEPRHLLRGILAEEEGAGVSLLRKAGVDWPRLQASLGLPGPAASLQSSGSMSLHPSSQLVLHAAGELTRLHGDEGSVKTEHVLVALLTKEKGLRDELEVFGLDFQELRGHVVGDTTDIVLDEPLVIHDLTENVNTARILDANANRVREALRVMEDYARFVLNDAFLSGRLKRLRHEFAKAMELVPASLLMESRDTQNDVGTSISTEQEWDRPSLLSVVQANAKRLQEGLRSLAEFGKVVETAFAGQIETIRYESYTLERALVQGGAANGRLMEVNLLVLVTARMCHFSLPGTVKEAILGGARMIQLREKDLPDREFLAHARTLRQLTRAENVLFIINDRVDIAHLVDADGVHLGQDDFPVQEARRLLSPGALIGVSTHNLEQVGQAVLDGANYVGIGPTFPSSTKSFPTLAGIDFVREALKQTSLPAFAIGGINEENVAQLHQAGARRIAVSHAICASDDPCAAARRLLAALNERTL